MKNKENGNPNPNSQRLQTLHPHHTPAWALQEQQLRDLFDEHSGRHDRFERIAEEMGVEGLTAAKVGPLPGLPACLCGL